MEQWEHLHKTGRNENLHNYFRKKIHKLNNYFLSIYYEPHAFLGIEETEGKF